MAQGPTGRVLNKPFNIAENVCHHCSGENRPIPYKSRGKPIVCGMFHHRLRGCKGREAG